jgi:hypothetical protein
VPPNSNHPYLCLDNRYRSLLYGQRGLSVQIQRPEASPNTLPR